MEDYNEDYNEPSTSVFPSDWRVVLQDMYKELTDEQVEEVDLYEQQNRLSQQWRPSGRNSKR